MPQFTNENTEQLPLRGDYLWQSAKKNFYYRNDYLKAIYLCNLIISRYPFTEEADDAKLLLHDIKIENLNVKRVSSQKKGSLSDPLDDLPGGRTGNCPYYCRDVQDTDNEHQQCFAWRRSPFTAAAPQPAYDSVYPGPSARMTIAIAVVALPIMGIAQDGIVGIAVPEIIALAVAGVLWWAPKKIASWWYTMSGRERVQPG